MPNLENLRKQAKQLVRWHRTRHFPVAALIAQWSPKSEGKTDEQILDGVFRLTDAQEIVARRNGFSSWGALTEGASEMSHEPPIHPRATLLDAEPQLFTTRLATSIEFYKSLGFGVVFEYGNPPFYAQVGRDGAKLNLRLVPALPFDAERAAGEEMLAASITVDNAKELFVEFQTAGAPFAQSLRTEPWGARTFIVRDPDGNLILFAQ